MCEFTVYVEDAGKKTMVTKGIVKAKVKNGILSLMDAAGNVTKVEGVSIATVDTLMQEMLLIKISG